MIQHLDSTLDKYLRLSTKLDAEDVSISFDAPTGDWSSSAKLPTINLFLWDLSVNRDEGGAGHGLARRVAGETTPMGRIRMTVRYLVTVWTSDVKGEHELLGRVFAAVVAEPFLRESLLTAEELKLTPGPVLRIGSLDERTRADLWSGFGSRPRAAIDLSVSLTVDPPLVLAGAAATRSRIVTPERVIRRRAGTGPAERFAGAVVKSSSAVAVIDDSGKFFIEAAENDELSIATDPPVTVRVPKSGPIELS